MIKKVTKWHILLPYLLDYRRSLILADFEEELGKPHQTLKPYIENLVKKSILSKEERKRHTTYRLNLENPFTYPHLSVAEKIRTDSILTENTLLKRLYENLSIYFPSRLFLVFGSYGLNKSGNDIDLLLIGDYPESLREEVKNFSETYKEVHVTDVKSRSELDRRFLKEIIKKHVIFSGVDYFVEIFGDFYGKA